MVVIGSLLVACANIWVNAASAENVPVRRLQDVTIARPVVRGAESLRNVSGFD
jgi:hypothetical protein